MTGAPEMLDGRVKTLHPKIHGGILARRGTDEDIMKEHGINAIDLVVVNGVPTIRDGEQTGGLAGRALGDEGAAALGREVAAHPRFGNIEEFWWAAVAATGLLMEAAWIADELSKRRAHLPEIDASLVPVAGRVPELKPAE